MSTLADIVKTGVGRAANLGVKIKDRLLILAEHYGLSTPAVYEQIPYGSAEFNEAEKVDQPRRLVIPDREDAIQEVILDLTSKYYELQGKTTPKVDAFSITNRERKEKEHLQVIVYQPLKRHQYTNRPSAHM